MVYGLTEKLTPDARGGVSRCRKAMKQKRNPDWPARRKRAVQKAKKTALENFLEKIFLEIFSLFVHLKIVNSGL